MIIEMLLSNEAMTGDAYPHCTTDDLVFLCKTKLFMYMYVQNIFNIEKSAKCVPVFPIFSGVRNIY